MAQCIERDAIIEPLLNSLEVERHMRGPLLVSLLAELSTCMKLSPAFVLASSMLRSFEEGALDDIAFGGQLDALRALVRTLSQQLVSTCEQVA
ncbi:MAG: hypothetical protein FWD73_02970 [Polyangiaceae bacterium]|nr:hypothetical protein [Polyangiaceae bacterium]